MAPTFVSTLRVIVLAAVVIPGLADFDITSSRRSVIRSPQQCQLATIPDGYVVHPDVGAAYKVYDEEVTWSEARRGCISEGAHLADIDTHLKFEYLMTHVEEDYTWTGIHMMYGETEWVSSSTGLAMTTLPWASGEPNGENYCVTASKLPRGLRNSRCDFGAPYACELTIPENCNAQGVDETVIIEAK